MWKSSRREPGTRSALWRFLSICVLAALWCTVCARYAIAMERAEAQISALRTRIMEAEAEVTRLTLMYNLTPSVSPSQHGGAR